MDQEQVDKTPYTSPIAQTIEASGNLVNNVRNPTILFAVISFCMLGYFVYKMSDGMDRLSSRIDELGKAINNERIEHIRETEAINRVLNIPIKKNSKIQEEE